MGKVREITKSAKEKFKVRLVKNLLFVNAKIKGKKIKCSPDKKTLYPFEK